MGILLHHNVLLQILAELHILIKGLLKIMLLIKRSREAVIHRLRIAERHGIQHLLAVLRQHHIHRCAYTGNPCTEVSLLRLILEQLVEAPVSTERQRN
ncbi:hypothetical protein D3C76_1705220 [compost metagenome]